MLHLTGEGANTINNTPSPCSSNLWFYWKREHCGGQIILKVLVSCSLVVKLILICHNRMSITDSVLIGVYNLLWLLGNRSNPL